MRRVVCVFSLFVLSVLSADAHAVVIRQSIDFDFNGSICATGDLISCSINPERDVDRSFESRFLEIDPFDPSTGELQRVILSIGAHSPTTPFGIPEPAFLDYTASAIFSNGGTIRSFFGVDLRRGGISGARFTEATTRLPQFTIAECDDDPCAANDRFVTPLPPDLFVNDIALPDAGIFIDPTGNGLGFALFGGLVFDSIGAGVSQFRNGSGRVRGALNILYEFEPTGGDQTNDNGGGIGLPGGSTPVPGPATGSLFAAGLLGLGLITWRRRRSLSSTYG